MKSKELFVFDMDGVILDSMFELENIAVHLLLFHGYEKTMEAARRAYKSTTGMPFRMQLGELYPQHQKNTLVGDMYETEHRKAMPHFSFAQSAYKTLGEIRSCGIRTALISSTHKNIIKRNTAMKIMKFDHIGGYSVGEDKGWQLREAMRYCNTANTETVFFGDTIHDHDIAIQNAVDFVMTTTSTLQENVALCLSKWAA